MAEIRVNLGERSYSIKAGEGVLGNCGPLVKKIARGGGVAIVTNRKVNGLFGETCRRSLEKAGFRTETVILPDGERFKNLAQVSKIYDALVKKGFDRSDTIFALGGGVVGDIAGFAAATYMRGIDCIQAPTTLLAQVDSSVGGKTGVDYPGGKNLIGAFHQPRAVLADLSALKTLSEREFRCGMAEVIKYGIIKSPSFFGFLEKSVKEILRRKPVFLEEIVRKSCRIKADVVSEDEREAGLRAILNYGHTFGHGIETALDFKRLKHGEAVSIGMVMAAELSRRLGLCGEKSVTRIKNLLGAYGLPVVKPRSVSIDDVIEGMAHDKKKMAGSPRFVLINKIGSCIIKGDLPYNVERFV